MKQLIALLLALSLAASAASTDRIGSKSGARAALALGKRIKPLLKPTVAAVRPPVGAAAGTLLGRTFATLAARPAPVAVATPSPTPAGPPPKPVTWVTSWKQAWAVSRKTHRPVLLVFGTSWSPLCRTMDDTVWTLPRFRALAANYVMCRLDAEKDVLLANKLKITGYPTLLLSYEGRDLGRDVGLVPLARLADMMERGLRIVKTIKE